MAKTDSGLRAKLCLSSSTSTSQLTHHNVKRLWLLVSQRTPPVRRTHQTNQWTDGQTDILWLDPRPFPPNQGMENSYTRQLWLPIFYDLHKPKKSFFIHSGKKKMLWRPLKQPEKYTQLKQTGRFWMYSSNIAVTRHAQNIFPKQSTKAQSPEPCPKTNPCRAAPAPRSCHRGRTPTGRQAAWPLPVSPGGVLSSPFLERKVSTLTHITLL